MAKKHRHRGKGEGAVPLTLEGMLTGSGLADLEASRVQLAIARAAEGKPLDGIISRSEVESYFGVPELPAIAPRLLVLICGVRSGKSFIAACAAIVACLRTNLTKLKKYEVPRFAIIGPTVDAARATFVLLLGILRASPVLSRFIDGEPTGDTVVLRRPDGRRIEISVVAAARGGATVRNRWLVGFILEEVAQIGAEVDGKVVNAEELLKAAKPRLLPGAKGYIISSPFGPQGLLHELWKEHFGKPGRTLVAWVPTLAMNPSIDPAEVEALRLEDPDAAAREFDAQWTDAESSFLASATLDRAIRPKPLERLPPDGVECFAAQDPATRGNAWTLTVGWAERGDERRVVVGGVWQWIGSKTAPLSPRLVFKEIAEILERYNVTRLESDQWSFDANVDHARDVGIELVQVKTPDQDAAYVRLAAVLAAEAIELPPDPVLRADLLGMRKRATANGVHVHLPKTAGGRHCDFAPPTALVATAASAGIGAAEFRRVLSDLNARVTPRKHVAGYGDVPGVESVGGLGSIVLDWTGAQLVYGASRRSRRSALDSIAVKPGRGGLGRSDRYGGF